PVHPRVVYPADLIDATVQDYESDARHKGLRLEVHINRTLKMKIDPDLFIDAFSNLFQNAIKYTSQGFVSVTTEEKEDSVLFRVEDSGPGISTERQMELFQLTQPMAPGGAGIGLSIAYRA